MTLETKSSKQNADVLQVICYCLVVFPSAMAFLCPTGFLSHRRRKRGVGDKNTKTIQDLARQEVEFEPTKMIVVQDFIPCVEDELKVKRGQIVKALYQENEWWFVVAENGGEGFIPYTFCIPIGDSSIKSKQQLFPLEKHHHDDPLNVIETSSDSASIQTLNSKSFQEFVKRNHGQYTVMFDFNAIQEDDVTVKEGERVTVLNKDDSDWYWVQTNDGGEGFIPKEYLHYFSSKSLSELNHQKMKEDSQLSLPAFLGDGENTKSAVKQLHVIKDFVAQGQYELTIHAGEQLFTDDKNLNQQTWIWVYSARTGQRGFVPRNYVRWAQSTTFL